MNLAGTLDIRAEGYTSPFAKMMFKALSSVVKTPPIENIESGYKIAVEMIEKAAKDKNILTLIPLKSIEIVKLLSGDKKEKKVSGRYDPTDDGIILRQTPAMRLLISQLVKHEFGHHLIDNFMNPKNHDSHGHLINPKGNDIYVNYELVDDLYNGALEEYTKEKSDVEKKSGVDIGDNPDENYSELFKVGTKAPSLYSLRTIDEWLGEAFALYCTPSEEKDAWSKKFPKTFAAIDAVLSGKVLNKKGKTE